MMRAPVNPAVYAGYTNVDVRLEDCKFQGHWIALEEDLETPGMPAGLIAVPKKSTTVGTILMVGAKIEEDIKPGDRVLFAAWQGGKWSFLRRDGSKVNVLVMDETFVQARLGGPRKAR